MPSVRVREILSAGAVVFGPGRSVLLVHRPRYDDWSFPKGKLERGEHATAAAVREVEEETGLRVRLGVPLGSQRYPVKDGMKTATYWVARPVGGRDVSRYEANREIDGVAWVPLEEAAERLSYSRDVHVLEEAVERRRKTRTLVVVRHGQARSRRTWRGNDRARPLLATGRQQAARLVPLLAAYDVRRLVSSSSTRCVETIAPYAQETGRRLRLEHGLSEEDATPKRVRRLLGELEKGLAERPASAGGVVVCTHRPVLPWVFKALGVQDPELAAGELVVLHLRRGELQGIERHLVR